MRKITDDIFEVGAIDWDRRLFDELIPLPDGTSYNAYLIKTGDKTVLIDSVDEAMADVLFENITAAGAENIDYIICNHAEQDHSGSIGLVLEKYPQAKVITNQKCKQQLMMLLNIAEDKFIIIQDGQEMAVGNKNLKFIFTPWVHWPETISTYLIEDKILFSCDFFGSHLATSDLYVANKELTLESAKRYFAEIMMPFAGAITNNIKKVRQLDISIIAPSHGPLYDEPQFIINAYEKWNSDYTSGKVIVAYVSMHGSTKKMVKYFVESLIEKGISVMQHNLIGGDTGKLAIELVDAAGVVLGTPTVLTGAHPAAASAAFLVNALRPKLKFAGIIGSYGWAGKTVEQLKTLLCNCKAEILEPVMAKGLPTEQDLKNLDNLAEIIKNKIKQD